MATASMRPTLEIYVMNADGSGQRNLTRRRGTTSGCLVARAEEIARD